MSDRGKLLVHLSAEGAARYPQSDTGLSGLPGDSGRAGASLGRVQIRGDTLETSLKKRR